MAGLLFLLEQFFCRRYLELRVVPYARRVTSAEGDAGTFSAPRPACRHRRRRRRVPHSDAAESGAPQREEKKLLFSGQQQLPAPPAAGGIESDHPPARAAPSHTVGFEGDDASAGANGNRPTEATPWPGRDFRLNKVLPGSVYLWACGERSDGDGTSPVSRPEHWAAWVVLIVSACGVFSLSGCCCCFCCSCVDSSLRVGFCVYVACVFNGRHAVGRATCPLLQDRPFPRTCTPSVGTNTAVEGNFVNSLRSFQR